jgi:hypothetical protein
MRAELSGTPKAEQDLRQSAFAHCVSYGETAFA